MRTIVETKKRYFINMFCINFESYKSFLKILKKIFLKNVSKISNFRMKTFIKKMVFLLFNYMKAVRKKQ